MKKGKKLNNAFPNELERGAFYFAKVAYVSAKAPPRFIGPPGDAGFIGDLTVGVLDT